MTARVAMYHVGCRQPAFFIDYEKQAHDPIARSVYVRYPDGTRPLPGDRAKCGSCGVPIGMRELRFSRVRAS